MVVENAYFNYFRPWSTRVKPCQLICFNQMKLIKDIVISMKDNLQHQPCVFFSHLAEA